MIKSLLIDSIKPLHRFLNCRNEREFYKLLDKWGGVKRYHQQSIPFLSYLFNVPDCASFIWQFKDIFVDKTYNFEPTNDPPIIYDCGANIGTSCLYFKQSYPEAKIYAYEADPTIAKILESNLLSNNIKDVIVENKAVWIHDKGIDFYQEGADCGSICGGKKKVKVSSVRLKDALDKESSIDMLKIDIEGAEVDLILDCKNSLNNVQNLFVEFHSWRNQPQRLDEILRVILESGFKYYIQAVNDRCQPFINKECYLEMDLQLNIFAYRT